MISSCMPYLLSFDKVFAVNLHAKSQDEPQTVVATATLTAAITTEKHLTSRFDSVCLTNAVGPWYDLTSDPA